MDVLENDFFILRQVQCPQQLGLVVREGLEADDFFIDGKCQIERLRDLFFSLPEGLATSERERIPSKVGRDSLSSKANFPTR